MYKISITDFVHPYLLQPLLFFFFFLLNEDKRYCLVTYHKTEFIKIRLKQK